jgi:hypothetical protein
MPNYVISGQYDIYEFLLPPSIHQFTALSIVRCKLISRIVIFPIVYADFIEKYLDNFGQNIKTKDILATKIAPEKRLFI